MEIPDWTLERYLLGELPPEDLQRVLEAATTNAAIQGRLDALQHSGQELLARRPASRVATAIRERAERPEASRERSRWPHPALLGLAAVLVVSVTVPFLLQKARPSSSRAVVEDDTRIKGLLPQLAVYRQTADGPERLGDGSHARAGDVVQVSYQAAGRTYGVIFSLDGRGVTTLHLPREGSQAAALNPGAMALQLAYRLDDAPRWERFYFIAARQPFPIEPLLRAAREGAAAGGRLALSPNFDQFTLTLDKEPNP